ncbi:hypothetical protein SK128_024994 [Halocaridina rubra]|uniref:Uncharacterized protein n=1 Tax=Halocaridina rubra TaxID=373956 RepID=A0AAN8WTU8_HALRR
MELAANSAHAQRGGVTTQLAAGAVHVLPSKEKLHYKGHSDSVFVRTCESEVVVQSVAFPQEFKLTLEIYFAQKDRLPVPELGTMPEYISVNDYISEVKDDISSPPTSNFVSKMLLCRQTVNELEEVREPSIWYSNLIF